jgi:glutaredoxin
MGKIIAYCKIGCPHSEKTRNTLHNLNKQYNINIDIFNILDSEKHKILEETSKITNNYKTFPIIIYENKEKELYFFGGNSNLEELLDNLQNINYCNNLSNNSKKIASYLYRKIISKK